MRTNSTTKKSFNAQVFEKSYKRLNLKKRERVIFQRLLGFLIRNDKPFPFSVPKLSELTEYGESSIFESLNMLEKYRLINRVGMGKNRKFIKGSILMLICSTVRKCNENVLVNNITTVQILDSKSINSPESGYKKTSLSLKHKEERILYFTEYQEYVTKIKADINLRLISENTKILDFNDWKLLDGDRLP